MITNRYRRIPVSTAVVIDSQKLREILHSVCNGINDLGASHGFMRKEGGRGRCARHAGSQWALIHLIGRVCEPTSVFLALPTDTQT